VLVDRRHVQNERVTELRLPGTGLVGQLPLGIGNLTQLNTLSLRSNALSGPIPADFANLALLQNLYLQNNLFSGDIPGFMYDMQSLVWLVLANNNFSGEISPRINNLTKLGTLFLESNSLTGSIPDIDIGTLAQFNVSFNRLTGPVPERLSAQPASAFEGNSLCGNPLQACPGSGSKSKLSGGAIAGIVIGSFVGFALIVNPTF
jgi:Leucine-rich repeat (LRR) protein